MKNFIFRNNTIEQLFTGKDYVYSGYEDISYIPDNADRYIWFYQIPIEYNQITLSEKVISYLQGLTYVLNSIDSEKTIIAFTIEDIYSVKFSDDDFRLTEAIDNYNNSLIELSRTHSNIKIAYFSSFVRNYDCKDLINWKYFFISQMAFNPKIVPAFKKWFNKLTDEISFKCKKCLVLDLDNTLWGGILGEDGINGIKIGGGYPGNAFLSFQKGLIELSKNGVILTICSKNNEKDVLEAWGKNPFIVLKKEYISAYRINWQDKATNIKELSQELNIGLDSFVFIDDNPAERELIKQIFPMIETPDFPVKPYILPVFFAGLVNDYFKTYSTTEEDKKKTKQYKINALRNKEQQTFTDFSTFLKSLNIELSIMAADKFNIPRIAQMTQKTNQFNLTTKRYTDSDIKNFLKDGYKIFCLSVKDKFGENGITGCIIINGNKIDELLLSCRILGKNIEYEFLKSILNKLNSEYGFNEIIAQYIPTLKNSQVESFYDKFGFNLIEKTNDGIKTYSLNLQDTDLQTEPFYKIVYL